MEFIVISELLSAICQRLFVRNLQALLTSSFPWQRVECVVAGSEHAGAGGVWRSGETRLHDEPAQTLQPAPIERNARHPTAATR